jgi:asparagine synthase (glutamine-hydrolysing)
MAHSVESRLPFLDHRLVEFVFGLPFDEKMCGAETKVIQRRAFADTLPTSISQRRDKVGLETPLNDWLNVHFEREIRPLLTSGRVRQREVFDRDGLGRCLEGFAARKRGTAPVIFRCLALEIWFELFIDGEGFRNGRTVAGRTAALESRAG